VGIALAVVAGVILLFAALLYWRIVDQGRRDEARPVDAIIVLGAAQWNGRPSPVLRARLDHAALLYHRDLAPRVLVTGGVGEGDVFSEAEVSKEYLVSRGIPADAIWMETQGRTSLESIRAAGRIMDAHEIDRALLVSDPFHMLRILRMAEDVGIKALGSPTRTSPIARNTRMELKYLVREIALYAWYVLSEN
jgi:uncharacterized SAM-binding protein YcdF (DUF218 family)